MLQTSDGQGDGHTAHPPTTALRGQKKTDIFGPLKTDTFGPLSAPGLGTRLRITGPFHRLHHLGWTRESGPQESAGRFNLSKAPEKPVGEQERD